MAKKKNRESDWIMNTLIIIVVTIFAAIVIVAGVAILVYGARTRLFEKRNCTLATYGIVKEKLYDNDTIIHDGPETRYGTEYTTGLRLLVNIDGKEYDVFNNTYSTAYYDYNEGDRVSIMINPDDLNEYYINERTSPGIFVFLLGAGMIALGAYLISVFWF